MPVSSATCRLAMTPPVRARHEQLDRRRGCGVQGHLAAVRADQHGRGLDPGAIQAFAHRLEPLADDRLQVGVGQCGRGALVLLPLGQHLEADRDGMLRQLPLEDRLDPELVVRVEVGEEQAAGDRLDLRDGPNRGRYPPHGVVVERLDHAPLGVDPLVELEAVPPQAERLRLHPAHVVVILAIAALNERHVPEALGRHIGDNGALPLEDRVCRHRRADPQMAERVPVGVILQPVEDRLHRIGGHGWHLPHPRLPGPIVMRDEIREGAPDIGTEHRGHQLPLSRAWRRQRHKAPCCASASCPLASSLGPAGAIDQPGR